MQSLESYLKNIRDILHNQTDTQSDKQILLNAIEEQRASHSGMPSFESFFTGEIHFYNGEYEQALKCYLDAKDIPNFQFYCYRASGLISKERGQIEKALNYIQKASKIDAQDPVVQQTLSSLLAFLGENQAEGPAELPHSLFEGGSSKNVIEELKSFSLVANKGESLAAVMLAEHEEGEGLKKSIQDFQRLQYERIENYLRQSSHNSKIKENALYVLNGWKEHSFKDYFLTEELLKSNGGHFIRWNNKGIALNPGANFFKFFHEQGFSIRDIDFVIVTRPDKEAYEDVKMICEWSQEVNRLTSERQIIHYYLHQKVFQELASFLRPNFKEARHTIHKLEMFLDSPDIEKAELTEGIVLHYFLTDSLDSVKEHRLNDSNLGICLELMNESCEVKLGYLSGMPWSPGLKHYLEDCDLILAGFGNTCLNDYGKIECREDALGYHGSATLYEELKPQLFLLSEFGGQDGDLRLEIVKKMRLEAQNNAHESVLLPADIGLTVALETLQVKCSISMDCMPAWQTRVAAIGDKFGRLSYLSANYCI